jgi:hypothetical protein
MSHAVSATLSYTSLRPLNMYMLTCCFHDINGGCESLVDVMVQCMQLYSHLTAYDTRAVYNK